MSIFYSWQIICYDPHKKFIAPALFSGSIGSIIRFTYMVQRYVTIDCIKNIFLVKVVSVWRSEWHKSCSKVSGGSSDFLTKLPSTVEAVATAAVRCVCVCEFMSATEVTSVLACLCVCLCVCVRARADLCACLCREIRFSFAVGKSTCQFSDGIGSLRTHVSAVSWPVHRANRVWLSWSCHLPRW